LLERTETLTREGLSSQVELETLQAQAASARASIELVEAQLQEAKSAIEETKELLSKTVVRAPIAGTIGRRNAEVGMQVSSNTQLFTIGDLSRLKVEVVLTEQLLSEVTVGLPVRIEIGSVTREGTLSGKISRISPFLDPVTRTTEAEIDIGNRGNVLRPGMSATVELLLGASMQAALIPTSALYSNPNTGEEGVYLLPALQARTSEEGLSAPTVIEFRPVQVLAEGQMELGVAGIEPDSWVVTVGQDLLSRGHKQARVRTSSWERIMDLQRLQREDLLREVLRPSQR
jgi:RND family efflux transporter MFP subunit